MNALNLGKLLNLCDSTLPIGGYTHSNSLETYVQLKIVKDSTSVEDYILSQLENNLCYNDASYLKLAYEIAETQNIEKLILLDFECSASKTAYELAQASQKLGIRLLKVFNRQIESGFSLEYEKLIQNKTLEGHYAIAFGILVQQFKIPLKDALYGFLYNAISGSITNAVKLVPLSQMVGQDILAKMHPNIEKAIKQTMHLERDLVGVSNMGFEIRAMQHEKLYSRLYMS